MTSTLHVHRMRSPIGTLILASRDGALCALEYEELEAQLRASLRARFGAGVAPAEGGDVDGLGARIRAYLEGDLQALRAIPAAPGGTPFQREVWAALREIPPGETTTYGGLAARLGRPAASRAVGLACARNPVAIVVPCHRVVGASGALTGYAGGLQRKRWLLAHEARALRVSALAASRS